MYESLGFPGTYLSNTGIRMSTLDKSRCPAGCQALHERGPCMGRPCPTAMEVQKNTLLAPSHVCTTEHTVYFLLLSAPSYMYAASQRVVPPLLLLHACSRYGWASRPTSPRRSTLSSTKLSGHPWTRRWGSGTLWGERAGPACGGWGLPVGGGASMHACDVHGKWRGSTALYVGSYMHAKCYPLRTV